MARITWINHACFMIESNDGLRIYIDPYQLGGDYGGKPADIVLATHDHYDHFDADSYERIRKDDTVLFAPKSCGKILGNYTEAVGVEPGKEYEAKGIKIRTVPAYNPSKKFHPKGNGWVGYIIEVDGKKIYHAGDTDYIDEFKDLKGAVDVALLPVGDTYTMGFKDAAKAAKTIEPGIVIPHHHWDSDLNEFKKLCEKKAPGVKVEVLQEGGSPLTL